MAATLADPSTTSTTTRPRSNSRWSSLTTGPMTPLTFVREIDPVDILAVPRHRRLQTLAVATWACCMPLCLVLFFLLCSIPRLWPIVILYLSWVFLIDKAQDRGGRPSERFRSSRLWRWFAEYYPASLVKEVDLPADRPYVFGYHPHGIIGMGAIATFATESTGFSRSFPGIKPHLLTLASNFQIPLYRDVLLALGICSVSKKSCNNILSAGPGSAICIVIGGATESLAARPGTADLTLKRRFGFIKVAIQQGASLVPVFSFGENDIYEQLSNEKGTTVYKLQKAFQSIFGFTLPLFHGRGLLTYNVGLLPFRHPIVSVIGRPIHVPKEDRPSKELVEKIQGLYIEELMRIWNTYKDVYAKERTRELVLVD